MEMVQFRYRFVDAYEKVDGLVEALDAGHAAVLVLQECGTEPGRPRWQRYGIKERSLDKAPRDAELVIFARLGDGSYWLELRKVGTRKRKHLRFYA